MTISSFKESKEALIECRERLILIRSQCKSIYSIESNSIIIKELDKSIEILLEIIRQIDCN